ncbi:hypothetical protein DRH29_02795 [candidate division Kazan bacterium]|uniref:Uncharacterized protein n=1 Tax=candidate division Kazan bacterium TaxID=2202143 RepID=A0A420ZCL4_UNCK3|nr:MAG: hypothetical protein DRH29_02795 [candidate division Kazan bacterium]
MGREGDGRLIAFSSRTPWANAQGVFFVSPNFQVGMKISYMLSLCQNIPDRLAHIFHIAPTMPRRMRIWQANCYMQSVCQHEDEPGTLFSYSNRLANMETGLVLHSALWQTAACYRTQRCIVQHRRAWYDAAVTSGMIRSW